MAKQKRNAKKTQEKILLTAQMLFSKKGFYATTADEIAKEAKVNKALIFYYFKNKSNLYSLIMNELLEKMYEEIKISNQNAVSIKEELHSFIKTYATYSQNHPYFPAILLRELSDSGAHIPELIFSSMRKLFGLLTEILKRGEKDNIFKSSIPVIINFMIIGSLNLMVTTKPLRIKASEIDTNIDACANCSVEEITEYVFQTIKSSLEV